MEEGKKVSWLWLFGINFVISAFTFGGGYVVIPMIRKYYVEKKHVFGEKELMNLAAIAQSSPGAIAINLSALAGYKAAKLPGAVISCVAAVVPPLIILSVISSFYTVFRDNWVVAAALKGMEAGVCALIVDVVWDMSKAVFGEKQPLLWILLPASFVLVFIFRANVMLVIIGGAALCFMTGWLNKKREARRGHSG